MKSIFRLCHVLVFCLLTTIPYAHAIAAAPVDTGWVGIGPTQAAASPNDPYYYKLVQVNGSASRYATVIELAISGDANFYDQQGTYQIRVDKYDGTPGRFDGLEIRCVSGNPAAATFYVYNDALWLKSNYKWGLIAYRTIAQFHASPLVAAPFAQTTTMPAGFLATTGSYGLKCDFDNNKFYQLPFQDTQGNLSVPGNIGAGTVPGYTLHVISPGNTNKAAAYLWGENYGTAIGTLNATAAHYAFAVLNNAKTDGSSAEGGGKPLLYVRGDGNVGIGTSVPQAKLAVKGDIFAQRVKVTQTGWADFVFHPEYKLPGLLEVERFVKQHRHLPEIPSQQEVEQNGQDVGEMNKKLLQKVEELTLYLIEMKKENEDLRKRMEAVEKKQDNGR
ncbi:hypothetical protein HF324_33105 [Chitinophaga oryzae]|uniref:Uncharacterized protein n=1 Tax=Chitinophaga oryzae TaxID=2725414 RepID=A0ABX6LQR7_9BACT|nr:hypothetical protein [Chitinophaga oryzae]QJB42431.1 hypothetical protein HF324_33105 [Chitinophaga oryzae]